MKVDIRKVEGLLRSSEAYIEAEAYGQAYRCLKEPETLAQKYPDLPEMNQHLPEIGQLIHLWEKKISR